MNFVAARESPVVMLAVSACGILNCQIEKPFLSSTMILPC
jgi:hypothetical protein